MTDLGVVGAREEHARSVLEDQRVTLHALLSRVSALRSAVPPVEGGPWCSPAQRRYAERLLRLAGALESASAELQGAIAATGTALARLGPRP